MAVLLDFRKIREDAQVVEYVFGYPEMDRRLTITKATGEGRPADGIADRDYVAVLVKIIRSWKAERTWPDRGMYAA